MEFQKIEDVQEHIDNHPEEGAIFAAWLMVRGAFKALTQEYTETEAIALLQKLTLTAPKEHASLDAEFHVKLTEHQNI